MSKIDTNVLEPPPRSQRGELILSLELMEVPGHGYLWRLRVADGTTVVESPVFASLQQCLQDARESSPLNPGTDPYTRRTYHVPVVAQRRQSILG